MKLFFFIALLFQCVKPFAGFEAFERSAVQDGRRHVQQFHYTHPDGRYTILNYDVHHAEEVVPLRDEAGLRSLVCEKQSLVLQYESEALAASSSIVIGSIVVGGFEWNCVSEQTGEPCSILRRVKRLMQRGSALKLYTEQARHTDAFENAEIELRTSYFPDDHFAHVYHPHPVEVTSGAHSSSALVTYDHAEHIEARKRFHMHHLHLKKHLKKVWKKTKELAKKVKDTVGKIVKLIKAFVLGTFKVDKEFDRTIGFNYIGSGNNTKAKDPSFLIGNGLSCDNCFGSIGMVLTFKLSVKLFTLKELLAQISGNAAFGFGTHLPNMTFSYEGSRTVFTIKMNTITVMVGPIPVVIQMNVPIDVGADVDAVATSPVKVAYLLRGSLTLGMSYSPSNGVRFLKGHSLVKSGGIITDTTANISAIADVYILAVLDMRIEYITGVQLGVKPQFQLLVESGKDQCGPVPSSFALQAALNWGFDIVVGAYIDVHLGKVKLFKKEWSPMTLVGAKGTLWNKCYPVGKTTPIITTKEIVGKTWYGSIEPGDQSFMWWNNGSALCTHDDTVASGEIAIQLLDATDPELAVWAISRVFQSDDDQCFEQKQYVGALPNSTLSTVLAEDLTADGLEIFTSNCSVGNYSRVHAYSLSTYAGGALSLLSLDYCTFAVLRGKDDVVLTPKSPSVVLTFEPFELPEWYFGSNCSGFEGNTAFSPEGYQSGRMLFPLHGDASTMEARIGYSFFQSEGAVRDFSQFKYFSFLAVKDAKIDLQSYVILRQFDSSSNDTLRFFSPLTPFQHSPSNVSVFNFDMTAPYWTLYTSVNGSLVPQPGLQALNSRDKISSVDFVVAWNSSKVKKGYASASFDNVVVDNKVLNEPIYSCALRKVAIKDQACGGSLLRYTHRGEPLLATGYETCSAPYSNTQAVVLPEDITVTGYVPTSFQRKCNANGVPFN